MEFASRSLYCKDGYSTVTTSTGLLTKARQQLYLHQGEILKVMDIHYDYWSEGDSLLVKNHACKRYVNFLFGSFHRGAELIEELRQKQMKVQEDQEVKILEKIKVKMERIKANQKKIQGAMTKADHEPRHHDAGEFIGLDSI